MQTKILKILIVLLIPIVCSAQSISSKIAQADSLFRIKQYTQSFAIYNSILNDKQYTPAMLLKMAYIQEGLGRSGQCLYYLNLYHLASGDDQTLVKMEELAQKTGIQGYQVAETNEFIRWLAKNRVSIYSVLIAFSVFFLAMTFFQRKRSASLVPPLAGLVAFLGLLLATNNFLNEPNLVLISSPRTYIVDAPSAGGSVIDVVSEGHRVEVEGKNDVWLKIKWQNRDAYIKESNASPIHL
jgi:hypothetical protein